MRGKWQTCELLQNPPPPKKHSATKKNDPWESDGSHPAFSSDLSPD